MSASDSSSQPGVNTLAAPLVQSLRTRASALGIGILPAAGGATIVDAGIGAPGGLEAGRRIAEICLGGLGRVALRASDGDGSWAWHVDVHAERPVIACLASQYAGWSLSHGEGKGAFMSLGSGPGRAAGSNEELFEELGYRDRADSAVLVLETDKAPPDALIEHIASRCGVSAKALTLILTPTSSLSGCVQIVARVVETALHKAHAVGFPLNAIVDGIGTAPLCPPAPGFLTAMGRTNDAILFGGNVQLFVDAEDADAADLARKLPASASADYGRPFAEIFKSVKYDFYKIDPMLFSPARVTVSCLRSGNSFHAGAVDTDLLNKSFTSDFG